MKFIKFLAVTLTVFSSIMAQANASVLNNGLVVALERSQTEFCGVDDVEIIKVAGDDFNSKGYVFYITYDILGDDGVCTLGGSGTNIGHIAYVENPNHPSFGIKVINRDILQNIDINTRFIDNSSIEISNNGILTFINNEYGVDPVTGASDPNCCAADRYFNTIRLSDLKLISRKPLGRDKWHSK